MIYHRVRQFVVSPPSLSLIWKEWYNIRVISPVFWTFFVKEQCEQKLLFCSHFSFKLTYCFLLAVVTHKLKPFLWYIMNFWGGTDIYEHSTGKICNNAATKNILIVPPPYSMMINTTVLVYNVQPLPCWLSLSNRSWFSFLISSADSLLAQQECQVVQSPYFSENSERVHRHNSPILNRLCERSITVQTFGVTKPFVSISLLFHAILDNWPKKNQEGEHCTDNR